MCILLSETFLPSRLQLSDQNLETLYSLKRYERDI